jgi:CheY-like chemotaxis protein
MAGGIAHDFRNFLTSIILYAQIPLRKPDIPGDVKKSLETVVGEAQQAANLVQQILDFSRRSVIRTERLDLGTLTQEVTEILQKTIPENISVTLERPSNRCVVNADPTRIQQVLMNLALNARDAMPDGGKLRITLARLRVEAGEEPLPEMTAGEWACLSVSDTGTGIDESVEEHLFEPFFTTKEPGKGTGLGLAQVYGIVKQHDGHIDVETAVGAGTTFRIYLPIDGDKGRITTDRRSTLVPGRGETILLVEDEERVREAIGRVLESLGYRALTAANGREAKRLAEKVDFDLLITDLVMPEMGGRTLIESLEKKRPGLKAIAMTGYAVEDDLQGLTAHVIQKPLDLETLAQTIRQALETD